MAGHRHAAHPAWPWPPVTASQSSCTLLDGERFPGNGIIGKRQTLAARFLVVLVTFSSDKNGVRGVRMFDRPRYRRGTILDDRYLLRIGESGHDIVNNCRSIFAARI